MPADPRGDPVLGRPRISAEAAARILCELFLANADRGDNAANDHLIAEMVGRIRTQQPPIPPACPTLTSDDGRHD
jgi:hypothetical protein